MTEPISFGTDGIRGIAGVPPLSPETLLAIGRAIGRWLRQQTGTTTVLIGRDTRPSGPQITHTLLAGLVAEGVTADDLGVITTPGAAHLVRSLGYSLGIVISASHNPAPQNGIKLIGADGFKLDDDAETAIEELIQEALALHQPVEQYGNVRQANVLTDRYLSHLTADLPPDALQGLSIVLDCANGASYALAPLAFAHLGAEVTTLGASPTGLNINVRSGSEYVRRNGETLLAAMNTNHAQVGIAFDGDADRVVFLTPAGKLVDGDHILALLAVHLKARDALPGDSVVATTMSNSGLAHYLGKQGIRLERTRVGDRHVMARIREGGFALGGEQAGHIILLDETHTAGDGIYIGLQVAALVARDLGLLDRLVAEMPRFPQVIASGHLARQVPLAEVADLQPLINETMVSFQQQGRVDVRYSGTEPNLLRVMVEGGLESTQEQVVERAMTICQLMAQASQTAELHIDVVDCTTGEPITIG